MNNVMPKFLFLTLVIVTLFSCKTKKAIQTDDSTVESKELVKETTEETRNADVKTTEESPVCLPVTVDADKYRKPLGSKAKVLSAVQEGNCVAVVLEFGGGCPKGGERNFEFIWDKTIRKSYPVQIGIKVRVLSDDPCKSLIKETVYLDLSSFDKKLVGKEAGIVFEGADFKLRCKMPQTK